MSSPDEKRRDETLKRMLGTPPKPHDDSKRPREAVKSRKATGAQQTSVDEKGKTDKV